MKGVARHVSGWLGTAALFLGCAHRRPTPLRAPPDFDGFVRVDQGRLMVRHRPYFFVGANLWYGANLGSRGAGGDRARLLRELDHLRALGVTNLRILAGSEGPNTAPWRVAPALQPSLGVYDDAVVDGLDFLLAAMKERGLTAVVCLTNFWFWSGGMAQYLAWMGEDAIPIPYPLAVGGDWTTFARFAARFYESSDATAAFRRHVAFVVGRTNRYTGIPYREDSTILAWELANEPRGGQDPRALGRWIHETAAFLKSLDGRHLVTTGSEGQTNDPVKAGVDVLRDHASPFVDYVTFHLWAQNWGWYDPELPDADGAGYRRAEEKARASIDEHVRLARMLGKPLVLEEFGFPRDGGSYDPAATTTRRDAYYAFILRALTAAAQRGDPVAGSNVWAWAGEGVPAFSHGPWRPGQRWGGDPPHEPAGWYSIYGTDQTTGQVIRRAANEAKRLTTPLFAMFTWQGFQRA